MNRNYLTYEQTKCKGDKKVEVSIKLADECGNGHSDFSVTGTVYEKDEYGRWKWSSCGCCHEEIAESFPEFQPFIELHLCDAKGAPMYAQENGFYHLRNSPREVTIKELRITEQEYDRFYREAEDQLYFTYLLQVMGIPTRWEYEAQAAIKELERLTGDTFVDESKRYQFTPLTDEEFRLVEARIAEGYYTPTNIRKRKAAAIRAKREKELAELRVRARNEKLKIDRELQVKTYVIKNNMPLDNFIYYDHSNTGVFNWLTGTLRQRVTKEQFDRFMQIVDYSKLPKGIRFELKSA